MRPLKPGEHNKLWGSALLLQAKCFEGWAHFHEAAAHEAAFEYGPQARPPPPLRAPSRAHPP